MTPRTLLEHLVEHAGRRPTAPALIDDQRVVTYTDLVELVAGGAALLADRGVRPGDRVLLQGHNSVALAVAYFATHAAGAVAVPVDAALSADALRHVIEECSPALLARVSGSSATAPPGLPVVDLAELGDRRAGPDLLRMPDPEQDADILFTTGTAGRQKGVLLSHANIAAAARHISTFMRQEPSDVELVPVPFSHSFGLGRLRCMAFTGNTVVPLPGIRFPAQLAEALERHRATGLAVVPAVMALLRRNAAPDEIPALSSLRYVELASAPIASDVRAWVLEAMPRTRLIHTYGLTEASRAAYVELADDESTRGSIGLPSANVEIEIRGEDGKQVDPGAEGEIWIRGPMVMRGYWGRPELTTAALQDGWLRTGDLAVRAPNSAVYLRGRASDMINVGGLKVAPEEVERLLLEHDAVGDAVCVGVPDPNGISGQRVKAYVVVKAEIGGAALVAWLRKRGLEAYKIPIAVDQIASIPRTASGKPLRRLL